MADGRWAQHEDSLQQEASNWRKRRPRLVAPLQKVPLVRDPTHALETGLSSSETRRFKNMQISKDLPLPLGGSSLGGELAASDTARVPPVQMPLPSASASASQQLLTVAPTPPHPAPAPQSLAAKPRQKVSPDPTKGWIPRPGADRETAIACVKHIQRCWRATTERRVLEAARQHLGVSAPIAGSMSLSLPPDSPSPSTASQKVPKTAFAGEIDGTSTILGSSSTLWTEAVTFRQPSVQQLVRAQERWLLQQSSEGNSDKGAEELQLLRSSDGQAILSDMMKVEKRLQLRRQPGDSTVWRPPCVLGQSLATTLEESLQDWKRRSLCSSFPDFGNFDDEAADATAQHQQQRREPTGPSSRDFDLSVVLDPCFALFELVLIGSWFHRRNPTEVEELLAGLHERLGNAPACSYLKAVSSSLLGRLEYWAGRVALARGHFSQALHLVQTARGLLEEREGPRDFWPVHNWEFAACGYVAAAALASSGNILAAIAEARELQALIEAEANLVQLQAKSRAPRAAKPRLTAALAEEALTLRLDLAVCQLVAPGTRRDAPAEWRQLKHDVEVAISQSNLPHLEASLRLSDAKLILHQELPWYLAGALREEEVAKVLHQLQTRLSDPFSEETLLFKVDPVTWCCRIMLGDLAGAQEAVEAWLSMAQDLLPKYRPDTSAAASSETSSSISASASASASTSALLFPASTRQQQQQQQQQPKSALNMLPRVKSKDLEDLFLAPVRDLKRLLSSLPSEPNPAGSGGKTSLEKALRACLSRFGAGFLEFLHGPRLLC